MRPTLACPSLATRIPGAALLAASLALPLGACSSGGGVGKISVSEEHELTLDGPLEAIHIDNKVGSVTMMADPDAQGITASLVVTGKGRTEEQAQESLESIEYTLVKGERSGRMAGVGEVRVPRNYFGRNGRGYNVRWRVTGPPEVFAHVRTNVGDVDVTSFTDGADIQTEVGDISVAKIDGPVRVDSQVGDINAQFVMGGVRAQSEVGDIRLRAAGPIKAESQVGDIRITILGDPEDEVVASSEVGSISLFLPTGAGGTIDARCGTGRVSHRVSSPLVLNGTGRTSKGRLKATLGEGGDARFRLRSEVGSIVIADSSGSTR